MMNESMIPFWEICSNKFNKYYNNHQPVIFAFKGLNPEYLRVVLREGVETSFLTGVCTVFRQLGNENTDFVMDFLENFSKVRRFKFSLSVLSKKEATGLLTMMK